MRTVGLNGKSVMPMISGFACAVPAIMSARNIENRKERLLTIMITPLMSCSARLPVYTILIGLVIPRTYYLAFWVSGTCDDGTVFIGTCNGADCFLCCQMVYQIKEKSFFILELPIYRQPKMEECCTTMIEKAKIFVPTPVK